MLRTSSICELILTSPSGKICTPLAALAHKLCRSNIKSSLRFQQPHISKATMSTVLLHTRLSSSPSLLNLLAPKSLCPKRLCLFPTPIPAPVSVSVVFSCRPKARLSSAHVNFYSIAETFLFQKARGPKRKIKFLVLNPVSKKMGPIRHCHLFSIIIMPLTILIHPYRPAHPDHGSVG